MDTKRIQPLQITSFARTKNTLRTYRYKRHTLVSKFIGITTENPESEANQNLDKSKRTFLTLSLDGRTNVTFKVKSKDFPHTKSGHPCFNYISRDDRTKLITLIRMYGNTASQVLAYAINIGLNPRQLGAIRRWHVADWRLLAPKM